MPSIYRPHACGHSLHSGFHMCSSAPLLFDARLYRQTGSDSFRAGDAPWPRRCGCLFSWMQIMIRLSTMHFCTCPLNSELSSLLQCGGKARAYSKETDRATKPVSREVMSGLCVRFILPTNQQTDEPKSKLRLVCALNSTNKQIRRKVMSGLWAR